METSTIIGIATVLALIYYLIKWKYSYWERKGVPFIKPQIPFGNFKEMGKTLHQSELFTRFYQQMKGTSKFFGMYSFQQPAIMVTDLDLIKQILIKDFNYFIDRGFYFNEKSDPLSAHLFSIEGQKWRALRNKLTPTFTSGKMKYMYPTLLNVSKEFKSTVDSMIAENGGSVDIEIKEILARFTTDVIGVCAFGIECNSLKNPDAEFRNIGRKAFTFHSHVVKILIITILPKLAHLIGLKMTEPDVENFFMNIIKETVSVRQQNNLKRNDFMDLLINLLKTEDKDGINMKELSAQAFVFFLAGFETSSTTMTFALYELAKNQEIQKRARQEISTVLEKHNGEFNYEAMMGMTYIDQIINESLRKYSPVSALNRVVANDYKVPGTDFVLEKGLKVFIPAHAIHHDPEYYPEPEIFNPDRFTPEEQRNRDNITFLPFGEGPRSCIGLRFGVMQAKVGLVTLLKNYEILFCEKSVVPLKMSKDNFILSPEGGVYLKFKNI